MQVLFNSYKDNHTSCSWLQPLCNKAGNHGTSYHNKPALYHCCKSWSAQAWKLLGNVHMCPSLCASMYTAPVYKGWPSSSFSVQGVSKFVHMLCTNWTLAWAHVYISKQFPSLVTPTSTAVYTENNECVAKMNAQKKKNNHTL